jgi:hypothetical protein
MSAQPQKYNFKDHYRGSTLSPLGIKFNFSIVGAEIICQIKANANTSIIHEWKTGTNITVVNAATGEIVLQQVNKFNPAAGNYVYDLQINFGDGTSQSYMKGNLKVKSGRIEVTEISQNINLTVDETTNVINIDVVETSTPITIEVSDIGLQGLRGKSAYQTALENGFIGTEQQWVDSLRIIIFENLAELP